MILDAESPPKSPVSSRSTNRQPPVSSPYHVTEVSHTVFPGTYSGGTRTSNGYYETTPLLYDRPPQSMYDDLQPPAYDDINESSQQGRARRRLWVRYAAILLVVVFGAGAISAYHFRKNTITPTQPSHDPVKEPVPNPPSPPPLPAPLPQLPRLPDPSAPSVPPTSGRSDLCHPWAYVPLDNRPIDRLVYTVPSLLPIHIESASICPTSSGQLELCSNTEEPISGKLEVLGADIELPQIEVSLRRGADDGLDNVSVCLMQKEDRWVLGLYAWRDEFTPLSQRLMPSASILVKLPYSRVHTLSTNLGYFTQTVGPSVLTETNGLEFDTLQFHVEGRGGIQIQNVTAATIYAKLEEDNLAMLDTRINRLLHLESVIGLLIGFVTLVHEDGALPVQVEVKSTYGTIEIDATLEYSAHSKTGPEFDINLYSTYSAAVTYIRDPYSRDWLAAQKPPSVLPIIRTNVTSKFALAQASVPATYHGSVELSSEYAAIATNDRAKGTPDRRVSWKERVGAVYRGAVEWAINGAPQEAGRIVVSTQFAAARLMFLGPVDDKIDMWQDEGTEIAYHLPATRGISRFAFL